MRALAPHTHNRLLPPPQENRAGGWSCNPDSVLCPPGPIAEVVVPVTGLGVLGCNLPSFQPAQGTHSPNRKEPVEREMWSDNRCSRKRGKKLLLKWQWKTCNPTEVVRRLPWRGESQWEQQEQPLSPCPSTWNMPEQNLKAIPVAYLILLKVRRNDKIVIRTIKFFLLN